MFNNLCRQWKASNAFVRLPNICKLSANIIDDVVKYGRIDFMCVIQYAVSNVKQHYRSTKHSESLVIYRL